MAKSKKSVAKPIFIVVLVLAIFTLLVVIPALSGDNNLFTKITYSNLKEDIKSEEFTFIYIGSKDCSHCTAMKPALSEIKEKYPEVIIEYLEYSTMTTEDKKDLLTVDERLSQMGTPTFLFIRYGKIQEVKIGQTATTEEFVELFDEIYQETNLYTDITAKDFIDKFKSKEKSVIFIGQSSCIHCEDFAPKVNSVISNYGVTIYHINFDLLTAADQEAIGKLDSKLEHFGTPFTIIVQKGKIIDSLSGDTPKATLINFLSDNGLME